MKYLASFTFLYLSLSFSLHSQDNLFKEGMEVYNKGNYLNSLIIFGQALENKYLINGKDLPKTYCYRAKSIINIYDQAIVKNDTFMLSRFPDMLIVAYEDLDEAKRFDNGKIRSELEKTFDDLGQITIKFCQSIAKQLRLDFQHKYEVDSLLDVIKDELVLLERHQFKNHEYLDLLGLIEYKAKNYELAEYYFEESQLLYDKESTGGSVDIDHLYSYYYNSLIKYHEKHEFEGSMVNVQKAKKKLSQSHTFFEDSIYVLDHSYLVSRLEDLELHLKLFVD